VLAKVKCSKSLIVRKRVHDLLTPCADFHKPLSDCLTLRQSQLRQALAVFAVVVGEGISVFSAEIELIVVVEVRVSPPRLEER